MGDHGAPQTGDRLRRGRRVFLSPWARLFATDPKKVWRQFDTDDFAGGVIRFEDGAGLQIESFWASHQPAEIQIELFGTDAGARLNPLTLYRTDPQGREEDLSISLPRSANIDAWQALASHFIACILDDETCSAPLRHGLQVQRMLERCCAA